MLMHVPKEVVHHHKEMNHNKYGTLLLKCVLIVLLENSSMKELCNVINKVLALLEHLN